MVDKEFSKGDVKKVVRNWHHNSVMSRNTLSDKNEIVQMFRYGRRKRGDLFTLIFKKNVSKQGSFVVSIAKKSLSHATDRNVVRRRTQNVLRSIFYEKELDFDCIAQFNAKEVRGSREVEADLVKLISNIK